MRNDLRLSDNPALSAACKGAYEVIALYVHETDAAVRPPGSAARWWLNQSLLSLRDRLAELGVQLKVETGQAQTVVAQAAEGADSVHWNRRYAPGEREVDAAIEQALMSNGLATYSHPGNVLCEPWTIATGTGKPYSVFTPFWRSLKRMEIERPLGAPRDQRIRPARSPEIKFSDPHWTEKLRNHWQIGEEAAQAALHAFLENIAAYPEGRDFPSRRATSHLSPHLRHGEISARQIWHAARSFAHAHPQYAAMVDKFLSELAWRDFNYHQLYHREDISQRAMQGKYEALHWRHAPAELAAWQTGQTGIPLVDAGMRELRATGYMENRVRMLAASFLTKNLLIDWRIGEAWFWDCLVDGDVANNPGNWQWIAGSGMDASPFFRIFNPVTQGDRFDADGEYVRRWVPELSGLPGRWIQKPFDAPADTLKQAGVELGTTYPKPIVDLRETRARALQAMKGI